jgi:hypothetical protein
MKEIGSDYRGRLVICQIDVEDNVNISNLNHFPLPPCKIQIQRKSPLVIDLMNKERIPTRLIFDFTSNPTAPTPVALC